MSELYDEVCAFWKEELMREPHEQVTEVVFRRLEEVRPSGYLFAPGEYKHEDPSLFWSFAHVTWRGVVLEVRVSGSDWHQSALLLMAEMARLHVLIQDARCYEPWMLDAVLRQGNAVEKK